MIIIIISCVSFNSFESTALGAAEDVLQVAPNREFLLFPHINPRTPANMDDIKTIEKQRYMALLLIKQPRILYIYLKTFPSVHALPSYGLSQVH